MSVRALARVRHRPVAAVSVLAAARPHQDLAPRHRELPLRRPPRAAAPGLRTVGAVLLQDLPRCLGPERLNAVVVLGPLQHEVAPVQVRVEQGLEGCEHTHIRMPAAFEAQATRGSDGASRAAAAASLVSSVPLSASWCVTNSTNANPRWVPSNFFGMRTLLSWPNALIVRTLVGWRRPEHIDRERPGLLQRPDQDAAAAYRKSSRSSLVDASKGTLRTTSLVSSSTSPSSRAAPELARLLGPAFGAVADGRSDSLSIHACPSTSTFCGRPVPKNEDVPNPMRCSG